MNKPKHQRSFALIAAAIALAAASFPAQAWRAVGGYGRGVAVGPRGGVAAWNHGAGVARGPYGGAAAWNHRGYYGHVYRPPVGVYGYHGGYYGYSGGAVAGAAVAGLAVGAMAGAAVASSNSAPSSTTVIVQQPAYSAQMPVGSQVTVLPGNCGSAAVRGVQYYQCGPNWFKPYFGNSSVYYRVVKAPY